MNTDRAGDEAPHNQTMRLAVIAAGVVVFLFAFRPFGLSIDSPEEALVLVGVAPLNFLIMLGVHAIPLRKAPWRAIVAISSLVVANTAYLGFWSRSARTLETGFAVLLVVGMTTLVAYLWNRGRIPEQDIGSDLIETGLFTLSGEGDGDVLQMNNDELLYLSADGNYVNVHYHTGSGVKKSMLRSSLNRLAAQVPGQRMVQCHRSYFVNLLAARRVVRSNGRTLIEFDDVERVPVSRKFRRNVVEALSG